MENVDKKFGIAKDPLLPRQVIRLTQKVKSRWVGETDYYCPGENKITTFSETLKHFGYQSLVPLKYEP